MASPNLPVQFPYPTEGMIKKTYEEQIDQLKCTCPGGALLKPVPLPSATINLGDVIADQARLLQAFTSAYGMIAVIIRMIKCIMDVICAINNPFTLIPAVIKLFGTCLPDFILLFPQLAVPAIIICYLKIILAIIEYIIEVVIPLIADIIENLAIITTAVKTGNADLLASVAFKIAALIKELYNILGIFAALSVLITMIKALIDAAVGLPCGGLGGACFGCGDDQCPTAIKQDSLDGVDGILTFIDTGIVDDPENFELRFSSVSQRSNFLAIRDFFPAGIDYSSITDRDKIAYVLDAYQVTGTPPTITNDSSFVVTSVRSNGTLEIEGLRYEFLADGYFSKLVGGVALIDPDDVRFGTNTETFTPSSDWTSRYIDIVDESYDSNNGTYQIIQVYDGYNVKLNKSGGFTVPGGSNPAAHIEWRRASIFTSSIAGSGYSFELDINHEELLRHDLIGVGCHPSVSASIASTNAKLPMPSTLPTLPTIPNVEACLAPLAPISVTPQYVLDNYATMANNAGNVASCLTNTLQSFEDEMIDYANQIYAPIIDRESSTLGAEPIIQIVGEEIDITLRLIDLHGGVMGLGLPAGTLDAEISTTAGTISSVTETLDEYGAPTGDYEATLTSDVPLVANLYAALDGYEVSDFDGYAYQTRYVTVEFVEPGALQRRAASITGDTPEPLGVGSSAEQ